MSTLLTLAHLKSLKENKDITILPADKGKAVVVMDREDYQSQCEKLLADNLTKTANKEIETKNPTKLFNGRIQRNLGPSRRQST